MIIHNKDLKGIQFPSRRKHIASLAAIFPLITAILATY